VKTLPETPLMQHVTAGIKRIRQQRFNELQLKLFPDWPEDRRGAPNAVVRSAVFGVVRRGRRKRITDLPIAGPEGWDITMTGWRLDQHDCDIWLEVMHLARDTKPGETVRFTIYSLLKRLGRTSHPSQDDRVWLEQRLKNLAATTIAYDSGRYVGVVGALLGGFRIDRETGEGVARTNPEIRPLFEEITHLNVEQRRELGQNQLAKALHAAISSHATWLPMRVVTLMHRIGAEYDRVRDFKRDLKAVLEDFAQRGWIRSYRFAAGADGELVEISKIGTPAQVRAIERRRLVDSL